MGDKGGGAGTRDHRGARRLGGKETAFWYIVAAVTYMSAAILEKGLLTWLIGPAWFVAVVVGGPALIDKIRGRS